MALLCVSPVVGSNAQSVFGVRRLWALTRRALTGQPVVGCNAQSADWPAQLLRSG